PPAPVAGALPPPPSAPPAPPAPALVDTAADPWRSTAAHAGAPAPAAAAQASTPTIAGTELRFAMVLPAYHAPPVGVGVADLPWPVARSGARAESATAKEGNS